MRAPRKKVLPEVPLEDPQWAGGPITVIVRPRPALTAQEFWETVKARFPAELHTPAAAFFLDLSDKARRAGVRKAAQGRPSHGIGQRVQDLMSGPLKLEQRLARRRIALSLCTCRDNDGFYIVPCRCDAYERVKVAHKQWRSDQQKAEKRKAEKRKSKK